MGDGVVDSKGYKRRRDLTAGGVASTKPVRRPSESEHRPTAWLRCAVGAEILGETACRVFSSDGDAEEYN